MLSVAGRIESTTGGFKFPDGTVQTTAATSGSAGWSLSGNAGTDPTDNFLGTIDEVPLEFRVNNKRVLRLEPNTFGPNVLGGSGSNNITPGVNSATISGGGQDGFAQRVTDNFGTVGGGGNNQAGNADGDVGNAMYATVSGGANNEASGHASTIGGGLGNIARNTNATIAGGIANDASGEDAAIGGGNSNTASGKGSTVSGGSGNDANALYATVGGGWSNAAHAAYATIAGGGRLDLSDPASGNRVTDHWGTVGGGGGNRAGTDDNQPNNATFATVGGGANNQAKAQYATISGGVGNIASGIAATVPGGGSNTAAGDYSFAAGLMAKANHNGTFVWADAQVADFASTAENQFLIRAAGGVGIGTNRPEAKLHVAGGDIVLGDDKIQNVNGRSVYLAGHVYLTPWSTGDVAYLQARRGDNSGSTQLQFRTSNDGAVVEAMRITNTGNVGIGTQSPGTNLHVRHSDSGETPDNVTGLFVENSGTGNGFFVFQTATAGGGKSFSITNAGNVGIGTTEPTATLQVAGDGIVIEDYGSKPFIRFLNNIHGLPPLEFTDTWLLQANEPDGGSFRIRNESDNVDRLVIDTNGNVIVNGQVVHSSDVRLKTHIRTIPDALNKVLKLRGVEFEWKKDSDRDKDPDPGLHIGLIAQEVESIFPELVETGPDGYKSVAYANVTAILIEAVKEQQKIIEKQEAENAAMHAELNSMKSKITDLTAKTVELQAALEALLQR
jgi:hypothetical protein